jgi:acetyltransferase-like isoleucine patch superfamily enzyme
MSRGSIVIERKTWIGARCVSRANVRTGEGVIIRSRSLVREDVADFAVVGGVTARVLWFPQSDLTP